jgi:uncharacterized protein (TIGR00255 family)
MALMSMTGFARKSGARGPVSWHWEAKSVNGRGLEVRSRLPSGFEALDLRIRALAQERFKRGNLQVVLSITRETAQTKIRINREALKEILDAIDELDEDVDADPPTMDGILGLRGVIEAVEAEESEEEHEALENDLLADVKETFERLHGARGEEGVRLGRVLGDQIGNIERLVRDAQGSAASQPDMLRKRLQEQLAILLEARPPLSEDRLAQEVALLATKADVREEIDRLLAHVAQARTLIASSEAGAGRRLDFLSQEFMREANTLCSKAEDISLTRTGLELKAIIDQFREQVQNVE